MWCLKVRECSKTDGGMGKDIRVHLRELPWSKLGKVTKYIMRLIDYNLQNEIKFRESMLIKTNN